jgi:hypothetical protein
VRVGAPFRAVLVGLFLVAFGACDFGGGGCVRIAQEGFTFPPKRIVDGAVTARVTQRGFDRITAQVKELILLFFGADEAGRAIIPLDTFGLGAIGTGFGPFDAGLSDLVLTLDLRSLSVSLVPGSSPARLDIRIRDAEIGLVSGTLAGSVDGLLISGDVACALANGPEDRIARLSLALSLSLSVDPDGRLDVRVLPSTFDVSDLDVAIETDCDLPQCLDGLPPGSTSECGECDTICPLGNVASRLVSALRDRFDALFDGLLDALADDLANLVLALFINDRPLAVEGLLPLGPVLGPVLSWIRTANPLAVFMRPAPSGITVSGAADGLGLQLVLDAGFDASTHRCVGPTGPDPDFIPGPPPIFDGYVRDAVGELVPYDLAIGVSDAIVNQAIFAAWKSGALCIAATTDDLARVSGGALRVGAPTLDLLLPGYAGLTGPSAPIRVAVSPRFDLAPRAVRFGRGPDGEVEVVFEGAELAVDAWLDDAWLRVLSMSADLSLVVDVVPTAEAELSLRVGALSVDGITFGVEPLFADARLDIIAPFVVDLALGVLAERPLSIDLGTRGLLGGTGVDLAPVVVAVDPVGDAGDWLGIHIALEPADALERLGAPLEAAPPWPAPRGQRVGADALAWLDVPAGRTCRLRQRGGLWSSAAVGPVSFGHALVAPPSAGAIPLEIECDGEVRGAVVEVAASSGVAMIGGAGVDDGARAPVEGCSASDGGGHLGALLLGLLALGFRSRRRRPLAPRLGLPLAMPVLVAASAASTLAIGGCSQEEPVPARACEVHSQCDDGFYCAAGGICEPATACEGDGDCCPGAVCFSGTCRPTDACGESAPCEGLGEVCEAGQCVPAACTDDAGCGAGRACIAGRCLEGPPCGGRCAADEVCDVPSGRCLAAPGCAASCEGQVRVAVWSGGAPHPMRCGEALACACAPSREPAPSPGVSPAVVVTGSGPVVLSHDRVTKGLVLTREDGTHAVLARPEPGGALGRGVAVAGPGSDGRLDALWMDVAGRALVAGRIDPDAARVEVAYPLPLAGESGRHQCLVRVDGPGGAYLAGWAYAASPADGRARLYRLRSLGPAPASAADWDIALEVESALPPTAARPCDGACGLLDTCVDDGGLARCAAVALVPPPACAACTAAEVCGSFREAAAGSPDDAAARCRTRIEPAARSADGRDARGDPDGPLPGGEGSLVRCAVGPGGTLTGAWRDAARGEIVVVTRREGGSARLGESRMALAAGTRPGEPLDVAVLPGGEVVVAFVEGASSGLYVAEAPSAAGPWDVREVGRQVAWVRALAGEVGQLHVISGAGRDGTVEVATRVGGAAGCWASVEALGGLHAGLAAARDGAELIVGSRRLAFEGVGAPAHRLVTVRVAPPTCTR